MTIAVVTSREGSLTVRVVQRRFCQNGSFPDIKHSTVYSFALVDILKCLVRVVFITHTGNKTELKNERFLEKK